MVRRSIRVGGGLLALMLVLTGCYKAEYDITVQDDGSGSLKYVVAVNYDILAALATSDEVDIDVPDSREQFCQDTYQEAIDSDESGSDEIRPYDDGTYCGAELIYSTGPGDDPGTELKSGLVSAGGEDVELSDWTLVRTETGWMFELPFPQDLLAGMGGETEADQASLLLVANSIDINYAVTLPGQAADNNASEVTDENGATKFAWSVDVGDPPTQLFANTLTTDTDSAATDTTTAPTTTVADTDSSDSTATSALDSETSPDDASTDGEVGDEVDVDGVDTDGDESASATFDGDSDSGLPLVPIGLGGAGLALLAGGGLFFITRSGKNNLANQTAGLPNQPMANAPMSFSHGSSGRQANSSAGGYPPSQQPLANQQTQIQGQPQAGAWTPMASPGQANPAGGSPTPAAPVQTFTQPEWDPTQGCWLVRDNSGSSYRHDAATNQWIPIS